MKEKSRDYLPKDKSLPYRRTLVILIHTFIIIVSNYLAFFIRFDGEIPGQQFNLFVSTLWMVVLVRFLSIGVLGLNKGLWRYAGLNDVFGIIKAVLGSTVVLYVLFAFILSIKGYPRSIYIIDSLLLILGLSGFRMMKRVLREYSPNIFGVGKRILLIGAGDAGEMVLREMKQNPEFCYHPIGFVDDNRGKRGVRIHGIPILGTRRDLEGLVKRYSIQELIICIPSASARQMRAIVKKGNQTGIPVRTIPGMKDILKGKVSLSQIRNVRLEDLLAREVIRTDLESIRSNMGGKKVLVTGAAGSIGSELCRQIADCSPDGIILFDQCENRLYFTLMELKEKYSDITFYPIVGDIRDQRTVEGVFKRERPEIVYHAAAYKQLPMMELNPLESIRNNVMGTMNVASAAREYGARRFVLISTDKAVNPTSVMGASKRFAERLVQGYAVDARETIFTIVRFGNVLGSNGSVVPVFKKQIEAGGPVTVTHRKIKRFFMTIPEAVQLVLQAGGMGKGGEAFVLDMGEQIKVLDLAENLIALSGYRVNEDIKIKITGLRSGEKLYEELFESMEKIEKTEYSRINKAIQMDHLSQKELSQYVEEFKKLIEQGDPVEVIRLLQKAIPTYSPSPTALKEENGLPKKGEVVKPLPLPQKSLQANPIPKEVPLHIS